MYTVTQSNTLRWALHKQVRFTEKRKCQQFDQFFPLQVSAYTAWFPSSFLPKPCSLKCETTRLCVTTVTTSNTEQCYNHLKQLRQVFCWQHLNTYTSKPNPKKGTGSPILKGQCMKFIFCHGRMMKSWRVSTLWSTLTTFSHPPREKEWGKSEGKAVYACMSRVKSEVTELSEHNGIS